MITSNRTCKECMVEKPTTDFYKRDGGRFFMSYCKTCWSVIRKQYRIKIKAKGHWKKSHIKWKYGLTLEQLEELLENQEFKCKICGIEFDNTIKSSSMCIDHDHKTNVVRGLLCNSCNIGLGMFKDSPAILKSAVDYIERTDEQL